MIDVHTMSHYIPIDSIAELGYVFIFNEGGEYGVYYLNAGIVLFVTQMKDGLELGKVY